MFQNGVETGVMYVMYQSIPSVAIPPGNPRENFQKSLNPWGKFFDYMPGVQASLGPLILINFTLFHRIQDLSH